MMQPSENPKGYAVSFMVTIVTQYQHFPIIGHGIAFTQT